MISVQIQDLLITPLSRLEVGTLCDLLALSSCDQLSAPTLRDLKHFRERVQREYADLPDGKVLDAFLDELAAVAPARLPACFREILLSRDLERLPASSRERLIGLAATLAGVEPAGVSLGASPRPRVQKPAAPRRRASRVARPRAPAPPAKLRDPERDRWIREVVLDRLSGYGSQGLKEAVLVAGVLHRAPWDDLGRDEVLAVLKRLRDQDVLLRSAGRWARKGRWF